MAAFLWLFESTTRRWFPALCDAAGHFQVDVLSSALPTGAATQATLADILIELAQKLEAGDLSLEAVTKYLNVVVKTCANPANLDLAITSLRDAIRGASTKDFTTLEADIEAIKANQQIQLARDVTWIRKSMGASNGSAIIHTVTTGKKFYLVHAALILYSVVAAGQNTRIQLRDGSDTYIVEILQAASRSASEGDANAASFPIPLEVPAGWDIYVTTTASAWGDASILGWEE